jgi:23S rRNA (adenine2503-C2)-methyltransferase
MKKKDIRTFDREELRAYLLELGEKKFRADQVYDWLWKKHVTDFEQMGNVPKSLRQTLEDNFLLSKVKIEDIQVSNDGTRKYAFRLAGGQQVEGVLIPTASRVTACILRRQAARWTVSFVPPACSTSSTTCTLTRSTIRCKSYGRSPKPTTGGP